MPKDPQSKPSSDTHVTAPENRVPVPRKVAYGSGMISYSLMVNGFSQMVNPIFNVTLGLSPVLIGWTTAIARLWDGFTDPLMGSITDNTRSRFGRRRPWVLLGSILGALAFIAVWWSPRGMSEDFYFWYLLITTLVFYAGFTVFSVPYIALGMEVSPDYHERTRVVAYRNFIGPIGAFAAQSLFWFTQLSVFEDTVEGMRYTSIGVGVLIVVFGLIPAIWGREHPDAQKGAKAQKKFKFFASAKQTLTVKPFLYLCAITVVLLLCLLMVNHLGFYVNLYHVYDGDQKASAGVFTVAGFVYQAVSMLSIPVIAWMSTRIGKRRTLYVFLGFAFAGTLSKWFCYTPDMPYLQLIPNALMGAGLAAVWMLINAMIPDTVDWDELNTGERREGMFSAVYSWMFKLGIALALLCSGYVIAWSGYDASLAELQSPESVFNMRVLYTLIPAIGIPIGALLIKYYPITEERAYEMQLELQNKRDQSST